MNLGQNRMAATVRKETSWRRRWKPDLNSQAWRPFNISDKKVLVKSMFIETDCSYELCLWDGSTLWYEKVEHDDLRARAKVKSSYISITLHAFPQLSSNLFMIDVYIRDKLTALLPESHHPK